MSIDPCNHTFSEIEDDNGDWRMISFVRLYRIHRAEHEFKPLQLIRQKAISEISIDDMWVNQMQRMNESKTDAQKL